MIHIATPSNTNSKQNHPLSSNYFHLYNQSQSVTQTQITYPNLRRFCRGQHHIFGDCHSALWNLSASSKRFTLKALALPPVDSHAFSTRASFVYREKLSLSQRLDQSQTDGCFCCIQTIKKKNLPFTPLSYHTWRGVIVPLDFFFGGGGVDEQFLLNVLPSLHEFKSYLHVFIIW